jgi:hypothetical protein
MRNRCDRFVAERTHTDERRDDRTKKNAAEAALKIWRHPSMKESLLAAGSITGITRLIHYKIDN